MAAVDDLIAQVADVKLRGRLQAALNEREYGNFALKITRYGETLSRRAAYHLASPHRSLQTGTERCAFDTIVEQGLWQGVSGRGFLTPLERVSRDDAKPLDAVHAGELE